jgi:hypothetical protein
VTYTSGRNVLSNVSSSVMTVPTLDPPRTSIVVPTWRVRLINISPFYSVSNFESKTRFPAEVSVAFLFSPRQNARNSSYNLTVSFHIISTSSFTNHTCKFSGWRVLLRWWYCGLLNLLMNCVCFEASTRSNVSLAEYESGKLLWNFETNYTWVKK